MLNYMKKFLGTKNRVVITEDVIIKIIDKLWPINQYIDPETQLVSLVRE
jgi:hypothetical protein